MPGPYDRGAARRRFWTNIALAVPVVALVVFLVRYEDCDAACADWDFVRDLLFDGGRGEFVQRWDHAPSVRTSNGNAEETEMLAGAVHELNRILSDAGFTLSIAREDTADIEITFGSREQLERFNPAFGTDAKIEGSARWTPYENGVLDHVDIYVLRNLQPGDKRGTLLHELGHAMGFAGHTDRYLSSLFHSELGYGFLSDGLSADDRKLLIFLYRNLSPGDGEGEVRAAFDEHWILRSE